MPSAKAARAAGILALAAASLTMAAAPMARAQEAAQIRPLAESPLPVIRVSGEGSAAIRPDMAILTLGIVREAETARAALDASNEASAAVIAALKEEGIAEGDLQTSSFRIDPRYVYPDRNDGQQAAPRIVGYTVSSQLTVRVRDLAKLGALLDRAVSLGVNAEGGIRFANANPDEAVAIARKAAMRNAAARALTLADAAGVELGPIIEITELANDPAPMPLARGRIAMAAESAVPVEAGEQEYTVAVQVTFEIRR